MVYDWSKKWHLLLITGLLLSQSIATGQIAQPIMQRSRQTISKGTANKLLTYLDKKQWNQLFPNRYGIGLKDSVLHFSDFYSFESLLIASNFFPNFLSDSVEDNNKRELSAFLANIAQETSGGWAEAPGGYFKWGLYFLTEKAPHTDSYNDTSKKNYPATEGKYYFGRGPKQLSWNYNYGAFSEAWFGSRDTLLNDPDRLAKDPVLAFVSALWFWMTPQLPKPSCHEIMTGKWIPTALDSLKGRLPGFGATVNVINGGLECGTDTEQQKTLYRYQYFQFFCKYFHVAPGENISCHSQKPFGQ